jgi:Putative beta-barrel porin 2
MHADVPAEGIPDSWRKMTFALALLLAALPAMGAEALADGVQAGAAVQESYDNNLYRLPTLPDSLLLRPGSSRQDHIITLAAIGNGQWSLGQQMFLMDLSLSDNRFVRNTDLNNTSGSAKAVWDWVATPLLFGDAGAEFNRTLASFAYERIFGRDLLQTLSYFADGGFRFANHWGLDSGVKYAHITHSLEDASNQDVRSRSGNLQLRYYTAESDYVGLDYRYTDYRFAGAGVISGLVFDSDSDDSTGSVVLKYALGGKTSLDADVGYLKRHYLRAERGSFSGQVWHATLSWQPSAKSRLDLAASRDLTAALEAQSDYFVARAFSVSPVWTPTTRISVALAAVWSTEDYLIATPSTIQFANRKDRLLTRRATLQYQPRDALTFNLSVEQGYRDSNVPIISYNDKLVSARVQLIVGDR